MSPTIIEDRLTNRARSLRVRWHSDGEALLKAGKFLEFADGLLRLMRQLDAIGSAVDRLSHLTHSGQQGGWGELPSATRAGSARPTRRPTRGIV